MIFLDTSAIYAVLDRDDAHHAPAKRMWEQLVQSSTAMATHNYVLVESYALAQSRLGMDAVRAIEDWVLPLVSIEWVSEAHHRAAVQMAVAANRRKLSVVDCVSFLVMRERGLRDAFTFDGHFGQQGFRMAPGS